MGHIKVSTCLLASLIILGLFARFWKLEQVPVYLYLDELDHIFMGEALARWGTDITGTWKPWQLRSAPASNVLAELPDVFYAIVQRIFGYGSDTAHVVSSIAGLSSVIFLSLIARQFFHSKRIVFITLAFALSTPLLVYVSRMAYEATLSTAFQLLLILGVVVFPSAVLSSKWKVVVSLAAMFSALPLAYYTYHGAKALLPFLIVLLSAYLAIKLKSLTLHKSWFVVPFILLLLQAVLLAQTFSLGSSDINRRIDSQMIFNHSLLSQQVNDERRMSLNYPYTNLIVNKPTVFMRNFLAGYLVAYDLGRLFVTGYEVGFQFSLIVYSFLYISSIPLLISGGVFVWKHRASRESQLLVLLILAAPITTALSGGGQSIFRSQLLYYLLVLITALGFHLFEENTIRSGKSMRWMKLILLSTICIEAVIFTVQYFNRYPVASAQNQYFSQELLTGYLSRTADPIAVVLGHPPYNEARSTITELGLMATLTSDQKLQFLKSDLNNYDLGRITLTSECVPLRPQETIIVDSSQLEKCSYIRQIATISAQPTYSKDTLKISLPTISAPSDSGAYYYILNDTVCDMQVLPKFIRPKSITEFNPKNMTNADFCRTWVIPEVHAVLN